MRRPSSGECPILGVREMSNSYRVVIQATDETLTVRARVTIVNFQFPDVPINRCFALQLLADAYYYLKERPEETNLPGRDAAKLASRADPRLIAYAEQLQSRHDEAFNRQIAERAEAEIVRVVELEQCNFEATDAWHEANERGDQPSVPFAALDVSQVLEARRRPTTDRAPRRRVHVGDRDVRAGQRDVQRGLMAEGAQIHATRADADPSGRRATIERCRDEALRRRLEKAT